MKKKYAFISHIFLYFSIINFGLSPWFIVEFLALLNKYLDFPCKLLHHLYFQNVEYFPITLASTSTLCLIMCCSLVVYMLHLFVNKTTNS